MHDNCKGVHEHECLLLLGGCMQGSAHHGLVVFQKLLKFSHRAGRAGVSVGAVSRKLVKQT